MGDKTDYTPELAYRICELVASKGDDGKVRKVKDVADIIGVNECTIYRWLNRHEEFSKLYTRARESRADIMAEEIIEIADKADDANIARVQIDARKWLAGKYNRKLYGEKVDTTTGHYLMSPEEALKKMIEEFG